MAIKNISIIGLGLIGGSLAKAIKQTNPAIRISAFDHKNILNQALEDGVIDKTLSAVTEAVESNAIFICLPVNFATEVFQELLPLLKENQILSDCCSIKGTFEKIWKQSNSKGIYIGGHPMTGKEKSGYESSDSMLFENSVYILTTCDKSKKEVLEFAKLLESIGSYITFLDANIHDWIVAEVSHLPQLIATSLVNTIFQHPNLNTLSFAAGGFRDMTRIASSPFNVWKPIIIQNKEKILNALNSFKSELNSVYNLIEKDDFEGLAKKFESAQIRRDEIPKNTKGFMSQLFDVYVYVKDQPGEMSKISTALYEANINIKDIELLKIREGSGATFRISFSTEADVEQAKKIMTSIGFSTKI
jgi:prephenate dehydrogenase